MKQKEKAGPENYLLRVPARPEGLRWKVGEDGIVTLEIDNTGLMKRITQRLLHKPGTSYIHLDQTGSFIWQQLDGRKDIITLGALLEAQFGTDVHPVYERLAQYFQILSRHHLIRWVK